MRYLGIDYGSKRVGLATSDEGEAFAFPKETIQRDANTIEEITDMIQELGIEGIVLGMPGTHHDLKNPVEADIRAFAQALGGATGLPIAFQDEQFSSVEASRYAPDAQKDDAVSAALILQRYLDAHTKSE